MIAKLEVPGSSPEAIDLPGRFLCRRPKPDEIVVQTVAVREGKDPNLFAVVEAGETPWSREGLFHYRAAPAQGPEGEVR